MSDPYDPYWFAGRAAESGEIDLRRIFLYHVPKTGGTTFFSAISAAFSLLFHIVRQQSPGAALPDVARFDDPALANLPRVAKDHVFAASHLPYPFHAKFPHPFSLMTILRDPYRRVLSSYTYACMRKGKSPSQAEFAIFIRRPENIAVQVKQLIGRQPQEAVTIEDGARAVELLQGKFSFYGTTDHIAALTSAILQWNCLPNVLIDHLNKTEQHYRFDGQALEDEVRALNAAEAPLFALAHANPALSPPGAPAGGVLPHPRTVLVRETENAGQSGGRLKGVATSTIVDRIVDGRLPKAEFDRLFAEA
jgi:hypothetical protein